MIWYRYWLEFRFRVLAVAVIALWIGFSSAEWAIFPRAAAQAFAIQMLYFAWAVGVCLVGNGLRTAFSRPGHASISYTLTLPVSRGRLISTHQALNCASALMMVVLALAAVCATLWLRGIDVPLIPLAMSAAIATFFVIGWITLLSALSMVMHELLAILAGAPVFVASLRWTHVTVAVVPAYGEFPWISVAALVTISVLALAFSLSQSRIQEFA